MRCVRIGKRALAGLMVMVACSKGSAESGPSQALRLGSSVWPPFTDVAERSRFAIDLVEEALVRADYRAQTEILDWSSVVAGLRAGKLDGCPAIWHTEERESYLLFSEPYLENRLVLVARKGTYVAVDSLARLAGKRIAVVEGYAYGEAVTEESAPVFVHGRDDQHNLERLLREEVDLMLVDELLIQHVLQHQPGEAREFLEIGSTPLVRRMLHLAVRKDLPGAEQVVARFNTEIGRMPGEGSFHRVLGLDWLRADADGDGRLELIAGAAGAGIRAPTTGYELPTRAERPVAEGSTQRYWIGGKLYESWDDVPQSYKTRDPVVIDHAAPPPGLKFRF